MKTQTLTKLKNFLFAGILILAFPVQNLFGYPLEAYATELIISVDAGPDLEACYDDNVTLTAIASGGVAPYNYIWYTDAELTQVVGSGPSITVEVLFTEQYYVKATDATGASAVDEISVILDIPTIGVVPECDPEGIFYILHVFSDSDENILTSPLGQVVDIGDAEWKVINIPVQDSVTISITSETGCTATRPVEPPECDTCALMVMVSDTTICDGGTAELEAHVGWGYPPYTFVWSDNPSFSPVLGTEETFSASDPGTYYVKVSFTFDTDPNSLEDELITCEAVDSAVVTVLLPPMILNELAECSATDVTKYNVSFDVVNATTTEAVGYNTFNGSGSFTVSDIPLTENLTIITTNDCGQDTVVIAAPLCCEPPSLEVDSVYCINPNEYLVKVTAGAGSTVSAGPFSITDLGNDMYEIGPVPDGTSVPITATIDTCTTTVTAGPPDEPCTCDPPEITVEEVSDCDDATFTYTVTFSVTNADSTFANGSLYLGMGPHTVADIPGDMDLTIAALSLCEPGDTVITTVPTPCCEDPEITVETVSDCDDNTFTYTVTFSVTNADSTFANGSLYLGMGPHTVADIPGDMDLTIAALSLCEPGDTVITTVPTPCCEDPEITVETVSDCDDNTFTYTVTFSVTNADSTFANGSLYLGMGPHTVADIPGDMDLTIAALSLCEPGDTVITTVPTPCCEDPEITVETVSDCDDNTFTYTVTFSVTNADSTFANGSLYLGMGPHTVADIPGDMDLLIQALNTCEPNDTIATTVPTPCVCEPPVITVEEVSDCDDNTFTYTVTFSVTNADSTFANGSLYLGMGPHTVADIPGDMDLLIQALNTCEPNDTIATTVPTPCVCEPPVITVEEVSDCDDNTFTYTVTFSVTNADSTFANGSLYLGMGPHTVADIPGDMDLLIQALNTCEPNDTIATTVPTPCVCDPPVITVEEVSDCDDNTFTYTVTFSVTNADSTFANGSLYLGMGPHTVADIPGDMDLLIQALNTCEPNDTIATTVPTPCVCEPPVITVEEVSDCDDNTFTYTVTFSVTNADSTFANGSLYLGMGPHTVADIPGDMDLLIQALNTCEPNDTIATTVPTPCVCEPPVITVEEVSDCDDNTFTYTVTFSVTNADSTFANGSLYLGMGPHTVADIPGDMDLLIQALNTCEPNDTIATTVPTPCVCEPPVITVEEVSDCDDNTFTYTVTFSVTNADSTFANGSLYLGMGPHTVADIPGDMDLLIQALNTCEPNDTIATTVPTPCVCEPPVITVEEVSDCDDNTFTYTVTFSVTNADSTFANGSLYLGMGPHTVADIPGDMDLLIQALNTCEPNDTIATTVPTPCVCEPPVITVEEVSDCDDNTFTYTVTFSVTNADSTFANGSLYLGMGPHTVADIPGDMDLLIQALNTCEPNDTIATTVPTPCVCEPPVITVEEVSDCDDNTFTYTVTFSVTNADSTFANGSLYLGMGPHTVADIPGDMDLLIQALNTCEPNDTIATTVPTPCVCEPPVITVEEVSDCDDNTFTYTVTFSVTNADSTFANGSLYLGMGPHTVADIPGDMDLLIQALNTCEPNDTIATTVPTPCVCEPPVITVEEVSDCDDNTFTYTVTFSVTNADSTFANGSLYLGMGPHTVADIPGDMDLLIQALNTCEPNDTIATTVPTPCVCEPPVITVEEVSDCDDNTFTYTVTFSVTNADSTFANGSLYLGMGPHTVADIPGDMDLLIQALNTCEPNDTIATTVPTPCVCEPPVITVEEVSDCDDNTFTYTVTFSVTNADSTFANGSLYLGMGPHTVADIPGDMDLLIQALNTCEPNDTIATTVPTPCVCEPPVITVEEVSDCDDATFTYTVTFSVTNADSTFANGTLYLGMGPHTVADIPGDMDLTIAALSLCEPGDTVITTVPTPCVCPQLIVDSVYCISDTSYLVKVTTSMDAVVSAGQYTVTDLGNDMYEIGPVPIEFVVTITATLDTCTVSVTVAPPPTPEVDAVVCDPDGENYQVWITAMGADSVVANIGTIDSSAAPQYQITVPLDSILIFSAFSECNADSVTVLPPPCPICDLAVVVQNDTSFCAGGTAELTIQVIGGSGEYTTEWYDNADCEGPPVGTSDTLMVSPDVTTTYYVLVVDSDIDSCEVKGPAGTVTIEMPPAIVLDTAFCTPGAPSYTVEITVEGADEVISSDGTINAANAPQYTITVPISNTEGIKIIANSACGSDTLEVGAVSCPVLCEVVLSVADTTICFGERVTLTALVEDGVMVESYKWSDLDGNGYPDTNAIQVIPPMNNTYVVELTTVTGELCADTATVEVRSSFLEFEKLCAPDSTGYTIKFLTNADELTHNTNGTLTLIGLDSVRLMDIYELSDIPSRDFVTITLTDNQTGCGTREVVVGPPECCVPALQPGDILALADRDPNLSIIHINEESQLDVEVPPCDNCTYVYNWTGPEDIVTPDIKNPIYRPKPGTPTGTYTFTVEVWRDIECIPIGFRDTVSVCIVSLCDEAVFVPNAFSPNGDGANDVFRVRAAQIDELQLVIYNRWGERITELRSLKDTWDGTFRGETLPSDVYGYYMEARCFNGERIFRKGNITLLK